MSDPSTGGQAILAFLVSVKSRYPQASDPQWDGDISDWSDEDVAGMLRSIAQDYLTDFGLGEHWHLVAQQAAFMLASLYYDLHEDPATPSWEVTVAPENLEGFSVSLVYSNQRKMPPVPSLSGAGASQVGLIPQSLMGASAARLLPPFDVFALPDVILARVAHQLIKSTGLKDRRPVMLAAAVLTLWRACQVTGVVTGGALFKQLRSPHLPDRSTQSVRVGFRRQSPAADQACSQSPDGGAFLLR